MTVNIPKFGSPPDTEESRMSKDFAIEVFQCTNQDEDRSKYVTILHASTDISKGRSEMNKITQFMQNREFDVIHKPGWDKDSDGVVDVIILGSDDARFEATYSIIRRISLGFLGIFPYWDVLWYGTDYSPQPDMPATVKPVCSNQEFSLDGICMIHANIRRRDDIAAWDGLYVVALKEIESHIDRVMGTQSTDSVYKKICRFEDKVKSDGLWGPDAELFFAAVEIIRNVRNTGAHSLTSRPKSKLANNIKKGEELMAKFDALAQKYNCPFRPRRFVLPMQPEDTAKLLKWLISLTQISVAWISGYPKPSNSNP